MDNVNMFKATFAAIGAWCGMKLGILGPILLLLILVEVTDYGTGMLSAKYLGKWNSRTGIWGIVKKLLYAIIVVIAMICDWCILEVSNQIGITVPIGTFFGLLTALWLIFNEIISIMENLSKLETKLPPFLSKFVIKFSEMLEQQGDKLIESIENKEEFK